MMMLDSNSTADRGAMEEETWSGISMAGESARGESTACSSEADVAGAASRAAAKASQAFMAHHRPLDLRVWGEAVGLRPRRLEPKDPFVHRLDAGVAGHGGRPRVGALQD